MVENYSECCYFLILYRLLCSLFCLGPNSIAPTRIGQPQSDRICQAHSHILRHIKIRRAGRRVPRVQRRLILIAVNLRRWNRKISKSRSYSDNCRGRGEVWCHVMHRWKVPTLANLFLSGILIDSSAARRRVKRGPQVCCVGPPCTFGALARWQVNINIVWQILPFTILHPDWRFIATTSVSVLWPIFGKIWIKMGSRNCLQSMQWLLARIIIDGTSATPWNSNGSNLSSLNTHFKRLSGLGAAYQNPNGHSASDARRQACCEPALELAFCINCGGACLCNLWPNLVWVWMPTG